MRTTTCVGVSVAAGGHYWALTSASGPEAWVYIYRQTSTPVDQLYCWCTVWNRMWPSCNDLSKHAKTLSCKRSRSIIRTTALWHGPEIACAELQQLATRHPRFGLTVVAHSMGGLVARHCLEAPGEGPPTCVTDVFLVGAPNHGSMLASERGVLELVCEVFPGLTSTDLGSLKDGLGEAGDDLLPGSLFLRRLNACHRAKGVRYYSAIGCKGLFREAQVRDIDRELQAAFTRRSVSAGIRDQALRILHSDEVCTQRGDGVVAVACGATRRCAR